jgi:hypothetical protein
VKTENTRSASRGAGTPTDSSDEVRDSRFPQWENGRLYLALGACVVILVIAAFAT